jgi:hypothetical protein
VSVIDTLAAVEAMPAVLVHTPHIGRLEEDAAAVKRIAGAGIPMTSTLQVFRAALRRRQQAALPRRRSPSRGTRSRARGRGP